MAYLGNNPGVAYAKTIKDTFSGDDSSTSFTLSVSASTNSIEVLVENVQQEPGVAYTVSNNILNFDSAPPSGTSNVYVIHRDPALQRTTLNDSSVVNSMLTVAAVETDNIANNSVTNAKLANDSAEFAELTLTSFNGVIKSTGGGQMYIAADSDIFLTSQDFLYTYADFRYGNGVRLFYDNNLRFTTVDSGVSVTGAVIADSYYGDGSALTGIDALPSQTGNGNKYLTTDGTVASWDSIDALPLQTGQNGKYLTTNGTDASWDSIGPDNDVFWVNSQSLTRSYTLTIGNSAMSAGPVTLDSGVTVTLDSGTRWVIV